MVVEFVARRREEHLTGWLQEWIYWCIAIYIKKKPAQLYTEELGVHEHF
jgi:hypothetical protein